MENKYVSKTTDIEQLQYSVDAAGKMVNAATNTPSSQTLHKAAHKTLDNAEDVVETNLRSSLEINRLVAEFEGKTLDKVEHQFDVSGGHQFDTKKE